VVPNFEAVSDYFRQLGVKFRSNRELVTNSEVNQLIASDIRRLNEHFGQYSQIKKFILLAEEWSLAGGELTPTMKLKRRQLLSKYANEIESLYNEIGQGAVLLQATDSELRSSVTTVAST